MGWWLISADTLAAGRFAVSPLAEALTALKTLHQGTAAHPGERAWLDAHLPAYRERLIGDPITALCVSAALAPTWNADFITPTPVVGASFEQEVARIRTTPPESARANLVVSLGGPLPARLHRDDLPGRVADLLEWVWARSVLPTWPRRWRVLEADVVARSARLGRGGWAAALTGMRPGMNWLGDGRLQISTHDYAPRSVAELLFVPVTLTRTWLSWDEAGRHAVVYPCAGVLADPGHAPASHALRALLGAARAGVLVLLDTPKSTTQLVALTGQGLGSVGRHLRVLLDAGLVERRRVGQSVLYDRTETGDLLVNAGR